MLSCHSRSCPAPLPLDPTSWEMDNTYLLRHDLKSQLVSQYLPPQVSRTLAACGPPRARPVCVWGVPAGSPWLPVSLPPVLLHRLFAAVARVPSVTSQGPGTPGHLT